MENPELICIKVIVRDGRKQFEGIKDDRQKHRLYIGEFGSWHNEREVDTPCILFRKGEYFDDALLAYRGSQSDGYHLIMGFKKLGEKGIPVDVCILADAFEEGDVITFIRTPHPNEIKLRASQT